MKTSFAAALFLFTVNCAQNQSAPPAAAPAETPDQTGQRVEPGATGVNAPSQSGTGAGASGAAEPGAATNMDGKTTSGTGAGAVGSPMGESRDSRVNSEVATETDPRKPDDAADLRPEATETTKTTTTTTTTKKGKKKK